jgi:hypothetical protein
VDTFPLRDSSFFYSLLLEVGGTFIEEGRGYKLRIGSWEKTTVELAGEVIGETGSLHVFCAMLGSIIDFTIVGILIPGLPERPSKSV